MTTDSPQLMVVHHQKLPSEPFFNLSQDLMCLVGFDGRFKKVNPSWTHLLGWSRSELLDQPALNIVHPDDHVVLQDARTKVREGRDTGHVEIRYRHKDGSYRWIWWNVFPHPEEQAIYAIGRDITQQKQNEILNNGQKQILEMVAVGKPLTETLNALVSLLEQHSPDMTCSILLLDEDGVHLRHGAAKSLAEKYCRAIDGLAIGPSAGSCGTAAFRREAVIVEDIALDPLWDQYRAYALPYELHACWSTPIFDAARKVLGTFAVYYNRPGGAVATHQHLIEIATQLAAIAITRYRDETALRLSEEKFTTVFRNAPVLMAISDLSNGAYIDANDYALQAAGFTRDEVIGRTAAELGWLKPHERQLLVDEIAQYGRIRGMEMTFHARTGQPVYGLVTGAQITIHGKQCLLTTSADITELKRVEDESRERKNYLDKIINHIGDPLFVKNDQHKFVLVNDAFCTFFDLPREQIIDVTLAEQTPLEQREHFWRIDKLVLAEGQDNVSEELIAIRNGEPRTISTRKTRYVDEAGNKFVIGVIHDITSRKQMEATLRRSKARLQGIFSAMAEGLIVQELDGRIVECNRAAESILGVVAEQIVGQPFEPGYRTIREDGSPYPNDMHPAMEVLRGGKPQRDVIMGICKPDQSVVWISVNAVPLHAVDDQMIGVVTSFSDITNSIVAQQALMRSEASLAAAQSRAKMGSWEMSFATQSISWSDEMFKIFGRDVSAGPPAFAEFASLIHPADRPAFMHEFNHAMTNKHEFNREFRVVWPDGSLHWIEGRGVFQIADNHEPLILKGTSQDITERKRLEEHLLQAQKMEAVGTLAGGIAHDFNNILAAIIGYTQLAKADTEHLPTQQTYLDAVLQGARRAAELVKQITTFSRQQETQRLKVTFQKIVAEALVLLRATIPANIEIRSTVDSDTPAILADPTQIHQIVMNLCTNAWHAMKSKQGLMQIHVDHVKLDEKFTKLHPSLKPGNHVRLSVTDNGIGMDQTTQARIFEPFFTTKAVGEGSGLGLAVVHGIVNAHHGDIVVSSVPQVGTTFELYFPALDIAHVKETTDVVNTSEAISSGRSHRVLLVDDESALVQLETRILKKLGCEVIAFTSSQTAFEAASAAPYDIDIIITDLSMPGMSGTDLVEQLRRLRPDLPALIVSGYVDDFSQQRIAALGIPNVLLKPFTLDIIGPAIQEALTGKIYK